MERNGVQVKERDLLAREAAEFDARWKLRSELIDRLTDECDRLARERDKWIELTKDQTKRKLDAMAERDRLLVEREARQLGPDRQMLRAEVDRLRAALERVVGVAWWHENEVVQELASIAHEALAGEGEK
jgi:hypothetical protein